jgi:hypothetical protein
MLKPLKPKQPFPNNIVLWILVGVLVISGIIAIVSAFSGGGDNAEDEVNAVYTNAAATLAIQQMTLQAASPSVTPTVPTPTASATFTPQPLATIPTVQGISTSSSTGGSASGAVGCNNSLFVSDVTVPDDTVMTPGQTFTKTWKLQNTGTCAWTTSYKVSFVSGNAMSGTTTALVAAVQPGQSGDVSVAMKAPATAGDAIGYWILTNDSGQNFGSSFYVKIKVGGTSSTGTAAVTATATTGASAPAAASNVAITLSCAPGGTGGTQKEHAGTLTWTDNSTNETGFNIYINSVFAATVASNTTSFGVPAGAFYDTGVTSTYAVEAINGSLKATQATVTVSCP